MQKRRLLDEQRQLREKENEEGPARCPHRDEFSGWSLISRLWTEVAKQKSACQSSMPPDMKWPQIITAGR
jgi:hypothetical protein